MAKVSLARPPDRESTRLEVPNLTALSRDTSAKHPPTGWHRHHLVQLITAQNVLRSGGHEP